MKITKPTKRDRVRVLGMCNRIRKRLGLEPMESILPGLVSSCSSCPIANTIRKSYNGSVYVCGMVVDIIPDYPSPCRAHKLPQYAKNFIQAFDLGWMPELDSELRDA